MYKKNKCAIIKINYYLRCNMENEVIDLYKYFNIKRENGAKGYLTTFIHQNSPEFTSTRIRPAMLVIPGGGYAMCSDREAEPIAISFLEKGYNSFVLNYSVAPVSFLCSSHVDFAVAREWFPSPTANRNVLPSA